MITTCSNCPLVRFIRVIKRNQFELFICVVRAGFGTTLPGKALASLLPAFQLLRCPAAVLLLLCYHWNHYSIGPCYNGLICTIFACPVRYIPTITNGPFNLT